MSKLFLALDKGLKPHSYVESFSPPGLLTARNIGNTPKVKDTTIDTQIKINMVKYSLI